MMNADKLLIKAYRECYQNLLSEMREGAEVDLSTACVAETKALQSATEKSV